MNIFRKLFTRKIPMVELVKAPVASKVLASTASPETSALKAAPKTAGKPVGNVIESQEAKRIRKDAIKRRRAAHITQAKK